MITVVHGKSQRELLQSCRDLEAKGWECIKAMHPLKLYRKHYHYQDNSHTRLARKRFTGAEEYTKWRAVYKKEEVG